MAKRATNLTVDEALLAEAKKLGLNLSRTFEEALEKRVKEERARRWKEENREAIESYNRYIDRHGAFSDKVRNW